MIGIGTFINVGTIIVGSTIGLLLKHNLKEQYKLVLIQAMGLATIVVGFAGALQGIFVINEGEKILETTNFLILILGMVIGSAIGVWMKIEERLNRFGEKVQNRMKNQQSNFSKGFVTATLIYCVGAMAITGSINDGLMGDYSLLLIKSMLDGIMSMILASTLGVGVLFSSIPVFIYQGSITLTAFFVGDFIPELVKTQMSIIGNVLIIGIGLNIAEIKKFKVADMLPAIFIPLIYYGLTELVKILN